MRPRASARSYVPELVAGAYLIIFFLFFFLSLNKPEGKLWQVAFLLTWPWSVALVYLAGWSMAHSDYPMEYYFVPCALLNAICLFLLCRLSKRRPNHLK